MLTSLNIIAPEYKNAFAGAIGRLRGDSITEEITRGAVGLRRITYIKRGAEPKPNKLYKRLGKNAVVLCSESTRLPEGITRFCSDSFSGRLCVNMALETLRRLDSPEELRLGIYDPEAAEADFLFEALKLCRSPVAVTCDILPYDRIRRLALELLGASAMITRNTRELGDCDLIVAPTRICVPLPIKRSAVVLTAGAPYVGLSGRIYGSYEPILPEPLERLRPPELGAEYFGSALYTLCGMFRLGSLVPTGCVSLDGRDRQTVESLRNLLDITNKKAYNS